jgi:FtsH-binding integral membrane protein
MAQINQTSLKQGDRMASNKSLHLFLGIVLICLGSLLGLAVAKVTFNFIRNPDRFSTQWLIGEQVLRIGLGAFCVWIGSREFQRATGQVVKEPRLRWGRMLAGTWLVFFSLESHFSPSPRALRADNESEAAGMLIATMLVVFAGMLLVAYSFKPQKSQSQVEPISESNPTQDDNMRAF